MDNQLQSLKKNARENMNLITKMLSHNNDNNDNDDLKSSTTNKPISKLKENMQILPQIISIQQKMITLCKELMTKHNDVISNWKTWSPLDVIDWIIHIDNGLYSEYSTTISDGIQRENVKGSSLKLVDDSCLLRWGVYDIAKRHKLLQSIKTLINTPIFASNSINILSIDHSSGSQNNGKYFNFYIAAMDNILGRNNWDKQTFDIYNLRKSTIQKIIIWRNCNGGSIGNAHGRNEPMNTSNPNDYKIGDILVMFRKQFNVLSVDHGSGPQNDGNYFNFDIATMDKILGRFNWGQQKFDSLNLRTKKKQKIIVWRSKNGGSIGDGHGREEPYNSAKPFKIGDVIVLL